MYCTRKVADDLIWVGADDRRLAMFEGVYSVPKGVSYNSYLLLDEKTVVFDTVDHAVEKTFLENIDSKFPTNSIMLNFKTYPLCIFQKRYIIKQTKLSAFTT